MAFLEGPVTWLPGPTGTNLCASFFLRDIVRRKRTKTRECILTQNNKISDNNSALEKNPAGIKNAPPDGSGRAFEVHYTSLVAQHGVR